MSAADRLRQLDQQVPRGEWSADGKMVRVSNPPYRFMTNLGHEGSAATVAALLNALPLLVAVVEAATEAVGYADEGDCEAVLDVADSELRTALDALREHLGVTE